MLLLLWLFSAVALWACAVRAFREASTDTDPDRRAVARAGALVASVPPTVVFLVSVFVLLQAAPTVQFNAGSARAMAVWSFWVDAWPALFGCSGLQAAGYLAWGLWAVATGQRRSVRYVVGCGLLSSAFGWVVLVTAAPSA